MKEGMKWGWMGLRALSCSVSRAVVRAELVLGLPDTPRAGPRLPPVFSR